MQRRNKQIDGLRGISMLMVVTYHLFFRYGELYLEEVPSFLLINRWGAISTTIFFVISGYYICGVTSNRKGINYFLNKVLRIWPSYALAIVFCFIFTRFIELPGRTVDFIDFILNLVFLNGFIGTPYVDAAHWYITSLMGCVIVYTFITLFEEKKKIVACLFFLLINAILITIDSIWPSKMILVLFRLIGGYNFAMVLTGYSLKRMNHGMDKKTNIVTILICYIYTAIMQNIGYAMVLFLATVIIYILTTKNVPIIGSSVLCWLGGISYSVYVVHQNIGYLLINIISSYIPYNYGVSFVCVILMIFLGWMVNYYFEIPIFQKLKKANYIL